MRFKSFIFLLLVPIVATSTARAQYCGGSYLNLELKFEKNVKPPEKVSYELFYVLPKLESGREIRDKKTIEFVSKFYYGDENKKNYFFWNLNESNWRFLKVSQRKAETYIENYKLEDFEVIYNSVYRDDHRRQLKGEFRYSQLRLQTEETDITPFLMKISATRFKPLYFLSSFLGGCHNLGNKHTILMKSRSKVR
jgi:hypothetical protein